MLNSSNIYVSNNTELINEACEDALEVIQLLNKDGLKVEIKDFLSELILLHWMLVRQTQAGFGIDNIKFRYHQRQGMFIRL